MSAHSSLNSIEPNIDCSASRLFGGTLPMTSDMAIPPKDLLEKKPFHPSCAFFARGFGLFVSVYFTTFNLMSTDISG